jgi:hypothetical protein
LCLHPPFGQRQRLARRLGAASFGGQRRFGQLQLLLPGRGTLGLRLRQFRRAARIGALRVGYRLLMRGLLEHLGRRLAPGL